MTRRLVEHRDVLARTATWVPAGATALEPA